jgi:hypothetical protein
LGDGAVTCTAVLTGNNALFDQYKIENNGDDGNVTPTATFTTNTTTATATENATATKTTTTASATATTTSSARRLGCDAFILGSMAMFAAFM